MNILIVVCNYKEKSFNHGIAEKVIKEYDDGSNVIYYHDLYAEKFDPLLYEDEFIQKDENQLDEYIQKACNELSIADIIVMIHPNWWGQPPAMLKGWIDRVFRVGTAYRFDETGKAIGMLKAKKAFVFNTSNTPEPIEINVYKDPLENLWKTCIFGMCGVHDVRRLMFKGIIKSNEETREEWLNEVVTLIREG